MWRRFLPTLASLIAIAAAGAQELPASNAGKKIAFNIPAQPVGSALEALGRQSGLTLVMDSALRQRAVTPKLIGHYTVSEALKVLLEASGLRAVYLDARTIVIVTADTPITEAAQDSSTHIKQSK